MNPEDVPRQNGSVLSRGALFLSNTLFVATSVGTGALLWAGYACVGSWSEYRASLNWLLAFCPPYPMLTIVNWRKIPIALKDPTMSATARHVHYT